MMLIGALPAIHAVRKQATLPHTMARITICERSDRRAGARPPSPPSVMPIDPKLAKPHSAYVAMITDLSCGETLTSW